MNLDSMLQAAEFVKNKLLERGYQIRSGVWVNDNHNILFTTVSPLGADESYFLKWDKQPFFTLGYEVNFPRQEKKGITINKQVFDSILKLCQPIILYANPDVVYAIPFDAFREHAIEHIQRFNQEEVMALPFSKLVGWA